MIKKLLFILMLMLAIVCAEDPLTLEQTLSLALVNSPKAKIIRNQYEVNLSKAYEGYGAILPNLSYSYSDMNRNTPKVESPDLPPDFIPGDETKIKTSELSASQLLFSFSGVAAYVAAGAAGKYADYSYADAKENFLLEARKTYYDLHSAADILKISKQAYTQASAHARETNLMYESGLISKKDYLDARVQELSAKQSLLSAEKYYQIALGNFNILLGQEKDIPVTLATQNIVFDPNIVSQNYDVADLTKYAIENKPGWQAFKETVKLAEADDYNAIGESLPSIYYIYSKQNDKYNPESLFTPNGDTETKGISASWKFFAGGSNLFKINEKRNQKELMQEQEKIMQQMQKIEVSNALLDFQQKAENYQTALEKADLAKEAFKIAEINFQTGNLNNTAYQDSLAQLIASETEVIKAGFDYEYAREYLNYSVGKKVL